MAEIVRYVNTNSTAGGDGTTNNTTGATRAYASLSEWEAAEATDLVTAGDNHVVNVYGGIDDVGGGMTTSGWTTDATHDVVVQLHSSQAISSAFNTSIYYLHATTSGLQGGVFTNDIEYLTFKDIQIEQDATNTSNGASGFASGATSNGLTLIDGCFARYTGGGGASWDIGFGLGDNSFTVYNSAVSGAFYRGIKCDYNNGGDTINVMNTTIIDAAGYGLGNLNGWGSTTWNVYNNLVDRSGTSDFEGYSVWDNHGGNFSGDATSPQTANRNETIYEDLNAPASHDFELTVDTTYEGSDRSSDFTVDINDVTRSDWDAGIHEVVASGLDDLYFINLNRRDMSPLLQM